MPSSADINRGSDKFQIITEIYFLECIGMSYLNPFDALRDELCLKAETHTERKDTSASNRFCSVNSSRDLAAYQHMYAHSDTAS